MSYNYKTVCNYCGYVGYAPILRKVFRVKTHGVCNLLGHDLEKSIASIFYA